MAYQQKLRAAPEVAQYCWQLSDDQGGCRGVLDPTDASGALLEPLPLLERLPALLPSASVSTSLALLNEPAPGADVNVDTREEGTVVYFVVGRDVAEGEELYLDYGRVYDRSSYQ